MSQLSDDMRAKAARARRLLTATEDQSTLRELRSFADECDAEAQRLEDGEEIADVTGQNE